MRTIDREFCTSIKDHRRRIEGLMFLYGAVSQDIPQTKPQIID